MRRMVRVGKWTGTPSPDAKACAAVYVKDYFKAERVWTRKEHGVLVVADYSNGHLYPLDLQPFPRGSFSGDRLDMPWVGLCDLDTGRDENDNLIYW